MKRPGLIFSVILCLLLVTFSARVTAAKESWVSVRSENFKLAGNASESEIREVAVRLEQYRGILARLFPRAVGASSVPVVVIVFKSDEAFKPFRPFYEGKPADVAGYFQAGRDLNYMAVSVGRRGGDSYRTIFHELVHLFTDSDLRGLPISLNEGLAEYYSTLKISDGGKKITLGQTNFSHARLLREKDLLPLESLLMADEKSSFYNDAKHRALFYAQSWALAHYLLHRDSGSNNLEKYSLLLNLLAEGETLEESLRKAFQTNIAGLEKALKAYVARRIPFPTIDVTFERGLEFAPKMQTAPVTESAAQGFLGDLLLHINRLEDAEIYLRNALALDHTSATAQASLGMLRLKQQRSAEALPLLKRAAETDTQNFLTQYYYGYALSRQEMSDEGVVRGYRPQTAAAMRAALRRAIELKPDFVEAYRLHAFVNLANNERLAEAESLLKRALEFAPGQQDILFVLAQVHLRQLNFAAVREALQPILYRAADGKLREQATALLEDAKYAEELASRTDDMTRLKAERDAAATVQTLNRESPAAEQAHAGRPLLRRRFKGERVFGKLTRIECADTGVTLFVRAGDRTLRLHGAELRSVFFVAYVAGLERTVKCGARNPENNVVLTYRPASDPRAQFDGEAVAIEFVPEDIEIEP